MPPKPKIRHADILLRCSTKEHKNCAVLVDALMKEFKNVTTAYTAKTDLDTDYCITASAIVHNGEIRKFQDELKNLKGGKKDNVKVSKIKVFVSRQV